MKLQIVWAVLILLKVRWTYGTCRWKTTGRTGTVQFRSSVFSSESGKPRMTPANIAQLILCAGRCLVDDRCVGIKAVKDGKMCSTLVKIKAEVGFIWKRNSGISSEALKTPSKKRRIFRATKANELILSSPASSGTWARSGKHGRGKSHVLMTDLNTGYTWRWHLEISAAGHPSLWETGSLLCHRSSQTVILLLATPPTLCHGMLHRQLLTCSAIPPNLGNIRGVQFHNNALFISTGKSINRIRFKNLKLTVPEPVKFFKEAPTKTAIDTLKGKSLIFWSEKKQTHIRRSRFAGRDDDPMDPIRIYSYHFTFTIDSIGHVIYVLTTQKKLIQVRDIHDAKTPPTLIDLKVIPVAGPIPELLFSLNTVYLIWPNSDLLVSYDVQADSVCSDSLTNRQISPPPRVIAIIRD